MLIKATDKIDRARMVTIPGIMNSEIFRRLQKGQEVDVPPETATYLIDHGFAIETPGPNTTTITPIDLEAING